MREPQAGLIAGPIERACRYSERGLNSLAHFLVASSAAFTWRSRTEANTINDLTQESRVEIRIAATGRPQPPDPTAGWTLPWRGRRSVPPEAAPMQTSERDAYLAFFRAAGALKDTLRSGHTPGGRRESTAEHTWRLCLMAVTLADALPGTDLRRLLELLVVHDLGEAVGGDVPAPLQAGDKTAAERGDLLGLLALLPEATRSRLLALWDEYNTLATPEARLAKGLDRLETVLSHIEGANPPGFDYAFNLAYGRAHTDAHPLTAALRGPIDAETARLAGRVSPGGRD
jgi:putative hydrolase of HD superfamily